MHRCSRESANCHQLRKNDDVSSQVVEFLLIVWFTKWLAALRAISGSEWQSCEFISSVSQQEVVRKAFRLPHRSRRTRQIPSGQRKSTLLPARIPYQSYTMYKAHWTCRLCLTTLKVIWMIVNSLIYINILMSLYNYTPSHTLTRRQVRWWLRLHNPQMASSGKKRRQASTRLSPTTGVLSDRQAIQRSTSFVAICALIHESATENYQMIALKRLGLTDV